MDCPINKSQSPRQMKREMAHRIQRPIFKPPLRSLKTMKPTRAHPSALLRGPAPAQQPNQIYHFTKQHQPKNNRDNRKAASVQMEG